VSIASLQATCLHRQKFGFALSCVLYLLAKASMPKL
jgi:hypothetical protein